MQELYKKIKISVVPGTIKRVQMDDATYFGPEYKDYISNSKLGLLNPAQGGSPQKFLEGFTSSGSEAFSLGSAVHQLSLEKEIYELSDISKPSGKLGDAYKAYLKNRSLGYPIEKSIILGCLDAEYYTSELMAYKGNTLPSRIKTAMTKLVSYHFLPKPEMSPDNKKYIYLPGNLLEKCKACRKSLDSHSLIQKALNWKNSYCEDVILCHLKVLMPKDFNDSSKGVHETIIKVKIKIDNWTIDHEKKRFVLNDLKTTGKPIQYFMGHTEKKLGFMKTEDVFVNGSWQIFHYARQMGMYLWLLKEYVKHEYGEGYQCAANMLVVETIGAFNSNIYPVSNDDLKFGFTEFVELTKRAAYHQIHGYEQIMEFEKNKIDNLWTL